MFPALERVLSERLRDELNEGRGRDRDLVICTRNGTPIGQGYLTSAVAQAA